jgi:type II secretory pathway pseudopilin PulG
MQDPLQQQQQKGNAIVANQFPQHQLQQGNISNASSSSNPALQQNILQARQQQLLQQMQQLQQLQQRQRSTQQKQPGVSSHTINVPLSSTSTDTMLEQLRHGGGGVVGPGLAQQMASHINLMLQPQPGSSQIQQQSARQQRSHSAVEMLSASYQQQQQQQQLGQSSNLSNALSTTNSQPSASGSQHGCIMSGTMVRGGSAMNNVEQQHSSACGQLHHSVHSSSSNFEQETHISGGNSVASAEAGGVEQRSFLDGRFAGGWQSNADLPDRRQVIYNILDVIRTMRPDMNRLSSK